ncbi:MAG: SOS response-associated peptidase family protein [Piscinibacter sp.]
MCYSAQIRADHRTYVRMFGADISIRKFVDLFYRRRQDTKLKIPKAMEEAFANPTTAEEREIHGLIAEHRAAQALKFEQELFKQRKRLVDAERKLQVKVTKAATEDVRIATSKIGKAKLDLEDLRRTDLLDRDSRIFPGVYAPVMVMQDGRKTVVPMRYQCRPAGRPASSDIDYPGTYNARRDNLEKFWRGQFGHTHGVMIVNAFYENVDRHRVEGRELGSEEQSENVVLEFRPQPVQDMLVACVWSHWTGSNLPDLDSFAAITDEPPPEVAAAGHDRCIIPIRPEHVDAWLNPDPTNLKALYDILDDRERPYYEHRMAA